MLLLLGLVAFLGQGTLSLLHSLLFAFALEAGLLVLGLFLSLVLKLLAPRPTSLSAQPLLSCTLAPSIARVAKPTFLTHLLVSMPDPALKLSEARTSFLLLLHLLDLTHDGHHLALLLRQIASFAVPPQLLVSLPLSLIKVWARCLSFLASLWLRAVVVGGVGRVGRAALEAHYRLRADHVSTVQMAMGLCLVLSQALGDKLGRGVGRIVCATD